MKIATPSLILLLGIFSSAAIPADDREEAAKAAALEWMSLLDQGNYAATWEDAAPVFRKQISRTRWTNAAAGVREPLGKLISRTLKRATYRTSVRGAPDGDYVVLQFDAAFENKKSAVETITPMKVNGGWKVSGYFVR